VEGDQREDAEGGDRRRRIDQCDGPRRESRDSARSAPGPPASCSSTPRPPTSCARYNGLGQLSEREREVAIALGRGRSNAEIASELFMSVATVKAHISRTLTKLNLNNRTQIALLAHDAGLTG
jgi:DNA-binding NarL/FixJ family response regulator